MPTSSAGTYAFANVSAGLYRVEIEQAGFKRFTQQNVEVQVDVTTRVDATLQVGNVSESVVVTTEAPPLQTTARPWGQPSVCEKLRAYLSVEET